MSGREKFPGETTYINTEEWRASFAAWLAKENRGAQEKLAELLGVSHGTLSRLKDGAVSKSTLIGPISRHCGLQLPRRVNDDNATAAAVLADIKRLDPTGHESLLEMILNHHARVKKKAKT